MRKNINIAIVGLGQIGGFLFSEINRKKNDIEVKTGKKNQNCGNFSQKS